MGDGDGVLIVALNGWVGLGGMAGDGGGIVAGAASGRVALGVVVGFGGGVLVDAVNRIVGLGGVVAVGVAVQARDNAMAATMSGKANSLAPRQQKDILFTDLLVPGPRMRSRIQILPYGCQFEFVDFRSGGHNCYYNRNRNRSTTDARQYPGVPFCEHCFPSQTCPRIRASPTQT